MMWEAFKYFGGGTGSPWSSTTWGPIPTNGVGVGTDKRDYPSNATAGSAYWAGADAELRLYVVVDHPQRCQSCRRIQAPDPPQRLRQELHRLHRHSDSQDNNNNTDAQALFMRRWRVDDTGQSRARPVPATKVRGICSIPTWTRRTGTQSVITYTIGTYSPPATGQIAAMITTMKSMAQQGGGSYYPATTIDKLVRRLLGHPRGDPGRQQHVRSASLPVSVNTQGTFLNQVYLGMFRPDAAGSPKWLGNVKQYQLKYDPPRASAPRRRRRSRCRRCEHGLRVRSGAKLLDDLVDLLDQLGAEQDRHGERFEGRPRSAEGRRGAAVARGEPDDAGQPQGVHLRRRCHDRRARLRGQRPAVGTPSTRRR